MSERTYTKPPGDYIKQAQVEGLQGLIRQTLFDLSGALTEFVDNEGDYPLDEYAAQVSHANSVIQKAREAIASLVQVDYEKAKHFR